MTQSLLPFGSYMWPDDGFQHVIIINLIQFMNFISCSYNWSTRSRGL